MAEVKRRARIVWISADEASHLGDSFGYE